MDVHHLLVIRKKIHPMTTSYYILDFDKTPYFQGRLNYPSLTDRVALVADPFSSKVTYYHWNDRII